MALLWPATSSAQANGGISLAPADLPRWDVSGDVGWLSSNKSEIGPDWNDWYDVASGGGSAGYYVTPNLKAELRLAFSGEGSIYQEERIDVPGQTFPAFRLREHHFRAHDASGRCRVPVLPRTSGSTRTSAPASRSSRESDRMFAQEWRVPPREPGRRRW